MRIVLVGAGGFGREWWPCLRDSQVEVVGVVDPDRAARTDAAAFFGLRPSSCHSDDESDCWSVDADFVLDCSPPSTRVAHAERALLHGKHLLVAKPMALTLADCRRILGSSRRWQKAVGVILPFRHLAAFGDVRDIVMSGSLGRLGLININFNVDGTFWKPGLEWRREMRHPVLHEGSIHVFDLVRWVTGDEPGKVVAHAFRLPWSTFKGSVGLNVSAEMRTGTAVRYRANWSPKGSDIVPLTSGWELEFEQGVVTVVDEGVMVNGSSVRDRRTSPTPLQELNADVLAWFVAHLSGTVPDGPTGADQARTMAFVEAVRRSAEDGVHVEVDDP